MPATLVSMGVAIELGTLLDRDPNHRGGRPFIAGTRVSVDRIGVLHSQGATPEDISRRYSLELAQVYAALAYYLANRTQIDAEIAEMDAEYDRRAAAQTDDRGPSA